MSHRISAILFDLGDTLMDETTEEKDATATTLRAELIPGAAEMVRYLKHKGYRLALVADSRPQTPPNVLRQHDLLSLFDHLSISEMVGSSKPEASIFLDALNGLGIGPAQYSSVVMVGNNLERDIVGANRLGLISVFFHWNDRRRSAPQTQDEKPAYIVHSAQDVVRLVERLDSAGPLDPRP